MVTVIAVAVATGACSQAPTSSTPTASKPTTAQDSLPSAAATTPALLVVNDDCANTSGHQYAQRGDLSIGPFMSEALSLPKGYAAAKVWVASQRDGLDNASLTILGPDGMTEQQTRPSGQAFVSNARQFYPGEIQVRVSGTYRIDVHVGPDHICVIAHYSLTPT